MEFAGALNSTEEANVVVEREVIIERPAVTYEGMRVSWGGVWAGVLEGHSGGENIAFHNRFALGRAVARNAD
jgi:hypothetical protein